MSEPMQTIHLAPREGKAFSLAGDVYRTLATSEQTGGVSVILEVRVLPGGGPPPHVHRYEDEAFYILEGEVTFMVAGRNFTARAGSFVQGPRNIPHTFKNESHAPARVLAIITPPNFEKFAAELARPLPSFDSPPHPVTPEDIHKLLAVAPKYGIEILPGAA